MVSGSRRWWHNWLRLTLMCKDECVLDVRAAPGGKKQDILEIADVKFAGD